MVLFYSYFSTGVYPISKDSFCVVSCLFIDNSRGLVSYRRKAISNLGRVSLLVSNIKGGAIWLPMSNLMGGQIGRNCLTVEEMFINGQILMRCLPAESGALPFTLHNVRQRGLTSYPQGGGAVHNLWKTRPAGVKFDGGVIHTPSQKIYAKVRSP